MTDRALIFGTSYVDTQEKRYLFGEWCKLIRRMNPAADIIVVDSASPSLDVPIARANRIAILTLGDNIGHLAGGGQDGWGRAFARGLFHGVEGGYDHIVHIECDVLFAQPVDTVLRKMLEWGVPAAAPMAAPYQFIETGLIFLSTAYLAKTNFIQRYDWENAPRHPMPETRVVDILGSGLFALPLRGLRNDIGGVTASNISKLFPDGIDWITHAEPAIVRRFLEMNDG